MKLSNLIAKSKNGTEIIVSLIPLHKMQNTRQGSKKIEVGKRVLLSSGIEVDLNLDGRTFYTSLNQLYLYTTNFTETLSYQGNEFLKLTKFH